MLMSLQLQLANSVAHNGVNTHNHDHFKLDEFGCCGACAVELQLIMMFVNVITSCHSGNLFHICFYVELPDLMMYLCRYTYHCLLHVGDCGMTSDFVFFIYNQMHLVDTVVPW